MEEQYDFSMFKKENYEKYDFSMFEEKPKISRAKAFADNWLNQVLQFSGAANEAMGRPVSKTPEGLTLNEDMQAKAAKNASEGYEQHPVAGFTGGLTAGLQMSVPAITATAPLGGIPAAIAGRAAFGGQQYLSSKGARKTELLQGDSKNRFTAEQAASAGAVTDAALSTVFPLGFGKGRLAQATTGAILQPVAGALGDVAQNEKAKEYPNLIQVNPLDPARRLPEAAGGAIMAGMFGHSAPKKAEGSSDPANGMRSIIEKRYETARREYVSAKKNIDRLETAIANITAKDPEVASQIHARLTTQLEAHKQALEQATIVGKEAAQALGISAKKQAEPKPDTPIYDVREEGDPMSASYSVKEIDNVDWNGENVATTPTNFRQNPDINVLEQAKVTLENKLSKYDRSLPEEEQAYQRAKVALDQINDSIKEFGDRPSTKGMEISAIPERESISLTDPIDLGVTPKPIEVTEDTGPIGPTIRNALDSNEESLVMSILQKFGLEKDNIDVDLSDKSLPDGVGAGGMFPGYADKFGIKLNAQQQRAFDRAWIIGHEVGHVVLYKILNTKLWDGRVQKIITDYQKWATRHPDAAKQHGGILPDIISNERFTYFSEYFAQRVAENLANPHKKESVFKKFIQDMRSIWKDITAHHKLPIPAFKAVDELIRHVIAYNKEMLDTTGKTLWEYESTKVSYDEAIALHAPLMPKGEEGLGMSLYDSTKVLQDQERANDIGPTSVAAKHVFFDKLATKFQSNFFGRHYQSNFWDSPLIKHASSVIKNAANKKAKDVNDLLQGVASTTVGDKRLWTLQRKAAENSVKVLLNKANDMDVIAVYKVFDKGFGNKTYAESLKEFGGHLTDSQKKIFMSLAEMFDRLYQIGRDHGNELSKKSVLPNVKGWFPSIRQGQYVVNLHWGSGLAKTFNYDGSIDLSTVVYSQRFFTKTEAEDFLKWFGTQNNQFGIKADRVEQYKPDPKLEQTKQSFMDELYKFLESTDSSEEIRLRMQEFNEKYVQEKGTLGGHHKKRLNVPGYKGSELWATNEQAGHSFRNAVFDSVEEYTSLMFKDRVKTELDQFIENPDLAKSHPNTHDVVKSMRDYAINEVEEFVRIEKFKNVLDEVANRLKFANPKTKGYVQQHVSDATIGKMSRMFYIYALIGRPSFWAAQGVQFLWSGRTLVKDGAGPLTALTSMGEGLRLAAEQPKEFRQGLKYIADNYHTFHPQFVNDLNTFHLVEFGEGTKGKLIADLLTGEKQSSSADSFSRYMSFAMMYAHYEKHGLKGKALWEKAAEATDENMVQYGRLEKAPIFQKLGPIGDLMSPLQTFSQAALGNFVADIKQIKRNPASIYAYLPALSTMAISILMAGAIGAPLVAEYEVLARLINWLARKFDVDYNLPLMSEWVLKGNNEISDKILSHGALSTATTAITSEGFDIGSSLRWQPVFGGIAQGEKSFTEMLPALNWAFGMAGAGKDVVRHLAGDEKLTEAELRNASSTLVPGWWKGVIADKYAEPYLPDMFGRNKREYTNAERAAKYLGTKTVSGSTEERKLRIDKDKQKMKQEEKIVLIRNIVDDLQKNPEQVKIFVRKLATDYKMSGDEIKQAIISEYQKRAVPEGVRQFIGSGGKVKKGMYLEHLDTFKENPLDE